MRLLLVLPTAPAPPLFIHKFQTNTYQIPLTSENVDHLTMQLESNLAYLSETVRTSIIDKVKSSESKVSSAHWQVNIQNQTATLKWIHFEGQKDASSEQISSQIIEIIASVPMPQAYETITLTQVEEVSEGFQVDIQNSTQISQLDITIIHNIVLQLTLRIKSQSAFCILSADDN